MKIDIHTHILPDHLPRWSQKFGYGGFIHLEHHKPCCARMMMDNEFFREIESNCWDAEVRMHECDHHGIGMQVLSTIPVLFSYWAKPDDCLDISMYLNDHIAGVVQRYPDRFMGLGTVPMQSSAHAVKELARCKQIGLRGIEIGSNINDVNLNEPQFDEIFAAAAELDMAVFVHPWQMMGAKQMSKYWLPWLVGMPAETSRAICSMIFGGIFERYKNLRVAFAHGGGSFPATIGRIEQGYRVRPDLTAIDNAVNPRDYLGQFYVDSLIHDVPFLEFVIQLMGEDKVMIGSDYPFPLGEDVPGSIIDELNLPQSTKDKLNYLNAQAWLGVKG
jgi:aminocarboxymuconate-semialdehyde decarboxylase